MTRAKVYRNQYGYWHAVEAHNKRAVKLAERLNIIKIDRDAS